ncbi:hypothetical protein COCSADRAFT_305723 [Bipolaris sorokiniana ND90Pr]|uniref:Uncharacterized protein n=1 Tax=Cochliobolus sativus (strain ND90Pr / ATCC 201652) TaxID=665912 RepID=M2SDR9_COCSN|nr:uncharacterized protein COCSADRAFT_305723 [Bipolaris sorokiniana ND90Pr]EMD65448.1 hypothetical protein COCSADRAFT_305723 [Bipolaris sorokiniana ND90Pr]
MWQVPAISMDNTTCFWPSLGLPSGVFWWIHRPRSDSARAFLAQHLSSLSFPHLHSSRFTLYAPLSIIFILVCGALAEQHALFEAAAFFFPSLSFLFPSLHIEGGLVVLFYRRQEKVAYVYAASLFLRVEDIRHGSALGLTKERCCCSSRNGRTGTGAPESAPSLPPLGEGAMSTILSSLVSLSEMTINSL